ncbi:hypothetical protein CDAR_569691 [Caerostris darwini]|uniref:Reverse transcriptase domain-containing protein n=1 Tax=Caerostris darwini TaxID=1538125 RepID=A0AAV4RZV7_9ARAC|nr:hypothetical protein CDAR_569691 [Caerostris darwini]
MLAHFLKLKNSKKISQFKVCSTIDLKSAYHQIPIKVSEKVFTEFEADGKFFQISKQNHYSIEKETYAIVKFLRYWRCNWKSDRGGVNVYRPTRITGTQVPKAILQTFILRNGDSPKE